MDNETRPSKEAIALAAHTMVTRVLAETLDLAHGAIDLVREESADKENVLVLSEDTANALEAVHNVLVMAPNQVEGIYEEAARIIREMEEGTFEVSETSEYRPGNYL